MMRLKYSMLLLLGFYSSSSFALSTSLEIDIAAFNLVPDFKLLFLGGIFVILMQAGFAVAEGGYEHNSKSIYSLIINYISAIIGIIFFSFI